MSGSQDVTYSNVSLFDVNPADIFPRPPQEMESVAAQAVENYNYGRKLSVALEELMTMLRTRAVNGTADRIIKELDGKGKYSLTKLARIQGERPYDSDRNYLTVRLVDEDDSESVTGDDIKAQAIFADGAERINQCLPTVRENRDILIVKVDEVWYIVNPTFTWKTYCRGE